MKTLSKLLTYLWIGIWIIATIIIFFFGIYICVKFYPEFISFSIARMVGSVLIGLIIFGTIPLLGYWVLQLILLSSENNSD